MVTNQTTVQTVIDPAAHMGAVVLTVANLAQSLDFYGKVLGITRIDQDNGEKTATIGVGSTPLLHLQEFQGARPQPTYSTGLYHVAILVPSRPDLGRVLINLARLQYPIQGFGDHFVSEAMYLADPDGNGLEIYRDRPRSEWQYNGRQIVMGTEAVDVDAVISEVVNPNTAFTGIAEGTVIGHVHLRVGNIAKAEAFYHDIIGFDVMAKMPSALFVSAGGALRGGWTAPLRRVAEDHRAEDREEPSARK